MDFCVFNQFGEFSIVMFSMDSFNNEVFNEDTDNTVFAGSKSLIKNKYYDRNLDTFKEFNEFYMSNGEFLEAQEKNYLKNGFWSVGRWQTVTRLSYHRLLYFMMNINHMI